MRRTLMGMWLLAGVTFLAISAWSGSARIGGAEAAGSIVNEAQRSSLADPTPPTVPEDGSLSPGGAQARPIVMPQIVPPTDGSIGNPTPPIAGTPSPNEQSGSVSNEGPLPTRPVPLFDERAGAIRVDVPSVRLRAIL